MGKTAKRQNKRAAAMLGAKGGTGAKKKSHAPVSAAAFGDAMGMQTDDAAGVNIQTATCEGHAKKSTTSVGRIARAVEADLTQEACVALDALLAEVEAARLEEETSGETGGAVGSASAAERQRLTLASHEVDAETAGSERKWESLRDKAVQATRALETELRALG